MAVDFKPNQNDYKNLTPFKSWLLLQINTWGQNNFPFVESDFDELTNYGMMQKLMKALNDVISNVNLVEEDMSNLFDAYTELQDYVNNYFDNLDVQEEINNKLDEMAEDGSLTILIGRFIQPLIDAQNQRIGQFESNVNTTINQLTSRIDAIPNGNPIAVSSTSQMTDTSKIYVLTTDGYWYYYNGTNWVQGGQYQSSSIDELVDDLKYRDDARLNAILNGNIKMYKGASSPAQISDSDGTIATRVDTNIQASAYYIPLEIGKTYSISSSGPLFNVYYYDATKTFISSEYPNSGLQTTTITFTNSNYGYIRIGSWQNGNSPLIFESKIVVQEITNFVPVNVQKKGIIVSNSSINIDTTNKLLITGPQTFIIAGNGLNYDISNKQYDITSHLTSGGWCRYNPSTDTINTQWTTETISIGAIWRNALKVDLFLHDNSTLLIDELPYKVDSEYINKNMICLGDSMTYGVGTTTCYYTYLLRMLGKFNIYPYGVGGSSITPKQGDYPAWDTELSFLERYSDMRNDGDLIIVFGGVNDWVTGRNLGTIDSTDTYTFYGAMKSLCNGLITKYPNKQIVFFTSPQNDYVNRKPSIPSDNPYYNNNDGYNRQGLKLEDYTKAMVEVCNIYGIPCERLDTKCWYGLCGSLGDGTLGSDNLHPNANGHKIIARNMASFIKNNR